MYFLSNACWENSFLEFKYSACQDTEFTFFFFFLLHNIFTAKLLNYIFFFFFLVFPGDRLLWGYDCCCPPPTSWFSHWLASHPHSYQFPWQQGTPPCIDKPDNVPRHHSDVTTCVFKYVGSWHSFLALKHSLLLFVAQCAFRKLLKYEGNMGKTHDPTAAQHLFWIHFHSVLKHNWWKSHNFVLCQNQDFTSKRPRLKGAQGGHSPQTDKEGDS